MTFNRRFRRTLFLALLPICAGAQSIDPNADSKMLLASLHSAPGLRLQRTSPTTQQPDGPVLYQIIFRSSASPGSIPKISPSFTLTNSLISEGSGFIAIGALSIDSTGSITFKSGQNFPLPAAAGDLSGSFPTLTVTGLQGRSIASLAPANGQVLQFNGSAWAPATLVGGGGGTVTSVGSGFGLIGGPITGSGTLAIDTSVVPQLAVSNNFNALNFFGGGLQLPPLGTASPGQGFNSGTLDLFASAYNTGAGNPVLQKFRWQAEPVNNNTASASATLNLLFNVGSAAPAETGLAIAGNGAITFAPVQTFPGTQIRSDAAINGQVLMANGTGGVSWQTLGSSQSNTWGLSGNTGTGCNTSLCAEFLGTTDNTSLELRVNNQRAYRIEPANSTVAGAPGFSPNIIGGVSGNSVTTGVGGATIAGGGSVALSTFNNRVTDDFGTVGGGTGNQAGDNAGTTADSVAATVGGGDFNVASGVGSTIAGGESNLASGDDSTVAGGDHNIASGKFATVAGGTQNIASGNFSFAAGSRADTNNHVGAFVWGDSVSLDVKATVDNQFVARASGGVIFYTNGALNNGVKVAAGGGSWASVSDRNVKENFAPVNSQQLLTRVLALPITTWNYKTQDANIRHLGPMAQDFFAAFNVGEDDTHITTVDEGGVALAAIQGLNQKLEEKIRMKDTQLAVQQKEIEAMRAEIEALKTALRQLR